MIYLSLGLIAGLLEKHGNAEVLAMIIAVFLLKDPELYTALVEAASGAAGARH